jgi:hypothetical protein
MQLGIIQLFSILSQYFQDTESNSIEPCTQCVDHIAAGVAEH